MNNRFFDGEDKILKYTPLAIMNIKNEFNELKKDSGSRVDAVTTVLPTEFKAIDVDFGSLDVVNSNTSSSSDSSMSDSNSMSNSNSMSKTRTIGARTPNNFFHKATIDSSMDQTGRYNFNNVDDSEFLNTNSNSGTSFVLALTVTITLVALVAIIALCIINFIYM